MAARFWVTGGTGNWNDTSNWSATSGGASGASVPGSADTAAFDASSGAGTATLDISPDIQTLTMTGFTGTLAFGTNTISLNSTGTIFTGATTMTVTGTPQIICTNSSATSRTISPGAVTEANSISFRVTAGTGTFTLSSTQVVKDLDFTDGVNPTGYSGAFSAQAITLYGSLKASTGMTQTVGASSITFAATSGTKTINTAGVTFDRPFIFNGIGGTFQLVANLTSGATRTATLTNGTLNLNGFVLSTGLFSTNTTNATTLAFGTGNITLTGTGTIFTGSTNCTVTGTPQVICTNNSATARTISPGAVTEANSISFRITAGTGSVTPSASSAFRDLDFTDGTNPTGWAGTLGTNAITVYGNFKASTGMLQGSGGNAITFAATSGTKTIDTAGVTFDRPFTFNGVGGTFQLQAALTSGSTRACTLTNGTLDLNGYTATFGSVSSSNSNVRTFAFGSTGKFVLLNSGVTVWTTSVATNLTVTGTNPLIQLTTNATTGTRGIIFGAAGEANAISVDVTAGSDQVNLSTTNGAYRNLNFTGFTGAISPQNSFLVFGNWNSGSATSIGPGTGTITFSATSGTKTITSSGLAFSGNVTFNGVGGTFSLQDALTVPSVNTVTLNNGTLTTNGYAVTAGFFASTNTNIRTLNLGASIVTITGTGTAWNITDPTNMTLNAGTSSIATTGNTAAITFNGGGLTYYNVTFGATYYNYAFTGANTFNNLTVASPPAAGRRNVTLSANQTINGTLTAGGSAENSRTRITGVFSGSTITAAAVSLSNTDFLDITAAGASSPWSGTNLGNGGGNTNITFATPKTVYWNQPAGGNWSDVAWALTSGGAVGASNFPLAQDAVILDNTGVGASTTIVMDYGWLIGSLSAASLTNALTIDWNSFGNLGVASYGDVTLSSAITITYTAGALGMDSLTSTAIITTAGVVIPIATVNINASSVTVRLADNFTSTGSVVGLVAGTLDLNGKTLSCVTFDSTFTDLEVRSIAFNGGQIDVTGNAATVWACEDLTNFSYTGTPTVNFTYSGGTGTRTIANGSTAGGTEANAVDFNIVAGSDAIGISNAGVVRNFTVQSAFTGQTGLFSLGFIYGNLLLSPSQTVSATGNATTFAATSGTKTITTNGVLIDRALVFQGVGGAWSLQDALTLGATRQLSLFAGTLTTNGYAVSCGKFVSAGVSVSGNRTLNLGASAFTCLGNNSLNASWEASDEAYVLTVNAGTSTIYMSEPFTGTSEQLFYGGGKTYYNVVFTTTQPGGFYSSSTFNSISNTAQPLTLSFEAGTTQTVDNFNVSGTSGNLVTMTSATPGTRWNLAKRTGGKVLVSFCSITDSAASPAGYWFAPTSQGNVNGGNNTGWNFASTGQNSGFMLLL